LEIFTVESVQKNVKKNFYCTFNFINIIVISEEQEGVIITLEGANAIFISNDKFVVSLKGGEM